MRKTRKSYKGGFLGFGEETANPNTSSYPSTTYPTSSSSSLDSVLGSVKNAYNSASQSVSNAYNSISNPTPTPIYTSTYSNPNEKKWYDISGWLSGGMRSRKKRGKRGGSLPDLSLATDVNGIKVVEPTYWIKGGKRKRSRSKSTRRYKKK